MPFPKKVQILSSVFWPFIKRPYLFVKIFLFFFSRSYVRFLYLVFISNFFKRYIEPNKQNKTLSGVAVNVLAWAAKEALKKIKRYWLTFNCPLKKTAIKELFTFILIYIYTGFTILLLCLIRLLLFPHPIQVLCPETVKEIYLWYKRLVLHLVCINVNYTACAF